VQRTGTLEVVVEGGERADGGHGGAPRYLTAAAVDSR
jgi:hypothetical protein